MTFLKKLGFQQKWGVSTVSPNNFPSISHDFSQKIGCPLDFPINFQKKIGFPLGFPINFHGFPPVPTGSHRCHFGAWPAPPPASTPSTPRPCGAAAPSPAKPRSGRRCAGTSEMEQWNMVNIILLVYLPFLLVNSIENCHL